MTSSWLDYVAFYEIASGVVDAGKKADNLPFYDFGSMILEGGGKVQLADPGIKALMLAVRLDDVDGNTFLENLTRKISLWKVQHSSKGPGQYDMSPIVNLRTTCDQYGWDGVDSMMQTLYGVTVSRAFSTPRTLIDPSDRGVDGDQCYSVSLKVRGNPGRASIHYEFADPWRFLTSSPEKLVDRLSSLVECHFFGTKLQERQPSATQISALADSSIPVAVNIKKNGLRVATMKVKLNADGASVEIDWPTARVMLDDRAVMASLAAIAPARDASRIKATFLEAALGL